MRELIVRTGFVSVICLAIALGVAATVTAIAPYDPPGTPVDIAPIIGNIR